MNRRKTQSKQEILDILRESEHALNHEMVQSQMSAAIDRATIYRVLNQFCADGITHRIVGDDGRQYFALCLNCEKEKHAHNHFHFRCLACGNVECIAGEIILPLPKGYVSEAFNGIISGYCATCR